MAETPYKKTATDGDEELTMEERKAKYLPLFSGFFKRICNNSKCMLCNRDCCSCYDS
jgi:hypothetical protein